MEFKTINELTFDPRQQMGEIFADGFYELGLKYISYDKSKLAKALDQIFDLQHFHFAVHNGDVMAFAACCTGKPPLLKLDKKTMVKALGIIRGQIAHFMLNRFLVNHTYPFEIPPQTGTIEFVATAAAYRGKGVAFDLLNHIHETMHYSEYILEVADTNTPAIRLFEKLGYKEFTRKPAPKKSGFSHFVYMKLVHSIVEGS